MNENGVWISTRTIRAHPHSEPLELHAAHRDSQSEKQYGWKCCTAPYAFSVQIAERLGTKLYRVLSAQTTDENRPMCSVNTLFTQRTDANAKHRRNKYIPPEDGQIRSIFAISVHTHTYIHCTTVHAHRSAVCVHHSTDQRRACGPVDSGSAFSQCTYQQTGQYRDKLVNPVCVCQNSPTVSLACFLLAFLYDAGGEPGKFSIWTASSKNVHLLKPKTNGVQFKKKMLLISNKKPPERETCQQDENRRQWSAIRTVQLLMQRWPPSNRTPASSSAVAVNQVCALAVCGELNWILLLKNFNLFEFVGDLCEQCAFDPIPFSIRHYQIVRIEKH